MMKHVQNTFWSPFYLYYIRKNYLKNPINEAKAFNYPKLFIKKNKSYDWNRDTIYKELFINKIEKYSRNVESK